MPCVSSNEQNKASLQSSNIQTSTAHSSKALGSPAQVRILQVSFLFFLRLWATGPGCFLGQLDGGRMMRMMDDSMDHDVALVLVALDGVRTRLCVTLALRGS